MKVTLEQVTNGWIIKVHTIQNGERVIVAESTARALSDVQRLLDGLIKKEGPIR